jgi:HEAT repeat protein
MKWRRVLWAGTVFLALGALIVVSPPYLERLFVWGFTPEGRSASHWLGALDDPDVEKRIDAIHHLSAMRADGDRVVPALARVMLDEGRTRGERIESAFAMTKLAPATRAVVPELTRAVGDRDPVVRMDAVIALMQLRGEARPAAAALTAAIRDDANDTNLTVFAFTIREHAVVALGFATAGTPEGVPVLTEALRDAQSPAALRAAARGLGAVGPDARPAVPRLRELSKDADPDVRDAAAEALASIGPGEG